MPPPGVTPPKFGGADREPEVRRAIPVFDRPKWLDGKRTYLGLILTTAGMLGKRFGWVLPVEEANGILDLIAANWDVIAEIAGLAFAAYGRFMTSARARKKGVKV